MFTIDNTTIILSAVLLVMALLTPLINPFFRKVRTSAIVTEPATTAEEAEDTDTPSTETTVENFSLPPVSIVFTPHDNASELEKYLPLYFNQSYDNDFQVIVVVPQGDHETNDVLKRFADNKRLYTTFIPDSSRYMSRKKLAITLGVKAAKYPWVVMADVCIYPQSDRWLQTLAQHCMNGRELVVGYTRYEDGTPDYRLFERYYEARYIMREYQHDHAYRCPFNALMFRKDLFLRQEGFRGNLKYLRGEFDFMVNKYAKGNNLAFESSPEGTLIEEVPTDKVWLSTHLFYMENRQHLQGSGRHRCLPIIDQLVLHGNYLILFAALAVSLLTHNWIITAASALGLLLTLILRMMIGKRALNRFDIDISAWKVIPYELAITWKRLGYKIKYRRANKYDFISHKL